MSDGPVRMRRGEQGQTLPLITLFMVVLLGFAGLVIDVGHKYLMQRHLQASVDLAALAGAALLPDASGAGKVAEPLLRTNYDPLPDPNADIVSCDDVDPDHYCLGATSSVATSFLRLFDVDTLDIRAEATVAIKTYTGFVNVAPWALTEDAFEDGKAYTSGFIIRGDKKDASSSLRGTTSIAVNANCGDSKSNDERDILTGATRVCELSAGKTIKSDPGSSTAEVQKGLNGRPGAVNDCSTTCLDTFTRVSATTGHREVTNFKHGNLILIPVVEEWEKKDEMEIERFVWFAIERWDKDNVFGQVVDPPSTLPPGMSCNGNPCGTGTWTEGSVGGKLVRLVA